jgi:hypothetical protein
MKRSFTLVFFFLTVWFLTGCETDSCGCTTYDLNIEVAIEDAAGNDLLDPSTKEYFEAQDIEMFYEIGGKLKTYASTNGGAPADHPKGFAIRPGDTGYVLDIFSNPTAGKKVVTLLRINGHPDIKLVTQINGSNGKRIEKLWYNDQLIWPTSGAMGFRKVMVTLE